MQNKFKLIGIIGEISPPSPTSAFQNFKRQGCVDTYTQSIEKVNAIPIIIPFVKEYNSDTIVSYISKIDGLLIPGGMDIEPSLYGEKRKEECQKSNKENDQFCLELIKEALFQKKPILGICKGCQLLNVALNGTLFQDQKYDLRESKEYNHSDLNKIDTPSHKIIINKDSKLNKIFNKQVLSVNSLHHQSINQVGNSLNLSALSLDGLVEAIEHENPNYFCIGVQWHPETLFTKDDSMKPLFEAFVNSI
ncbi:MAG: gamma-glutamyl-gamma-aminobutyrate hydrolase family protein [Sphaerochaetaceae bacterium]|nr:gamma-glutamyl-gamma-aminobutyrate hydrolase family protein [Sphaerochaetaceae bacterium]